MKPKFFFMILVVFMCLLTACDNAAESEAVVPTPSPLPTVTPTNTPTPEADDSLTVREDHLPYVTIDENCVLKEFAEYSGEEFRCNVYEIERFEASLGYSITVYWTVLVYKDDELISVLRQDVEEYAEAIPLASELVTEIDVDFDGKNDVLFLLGHFGTQGAVCYNCYLQRGGDFVECPSFSSIPNPAVDADNEVILSCWRNSAASHSYAMFRFEGGEYIERERLTEESLRSDSNDYEWIWAWTDEIFVDGEWEIREYFTDMDYDFETLYEKVHGENSYWGIDQDRWRTLFNNGLMSDFSIYGS